MNTAPRRHAHFWKSDRFASAKRWILHTWTTISHQQQIKQHLLARAILYWGIHKRNPYVRNYKRNLYVRNYSRNPSVRNYSRNPFVIPYKRNPFVRNYKRNPFVIPYRRIPSVKNYKRNPFVTNYKRNPFEGSGSTSWSPGNLDPKFLFFHFFNVVFV